MWWWNWNFKQFIIKSKLFFFFSWLLIFINKYIFICKKVTIDDDVAVAKLTQQNVENQKVVYILFFFKKKL